MRGSSYTRITLLLIMLVATVLRFYGFDDFSLTNDELSAIYRTKFQDFSQLIKEGVIATDPHPAGVQVFMFYWIKIFGDSAFWVRLPFVLSAIISVYVVYLLVKDWFTESSALLTAGFLAVSEFAITYGQIARPYTFGLLFCLLTALFWTRIMKKERPAIRDAAGYIFFSVAACYTHYFSGLFAVVIAITGFFLKDFKFWKYYIAINLTITLLFLPHIPITLHQLETGGLSGWLPKPDLNFFSSHFFYLFNESYLLLVPAVGVVIFAVIKFGNFKSANPFRWVAVVWFLFPMMLGYIYSLKHETVLMDRVLIFTFPFLPVFLFSFAAKLPPKTPVLLAVTGLMSLSVYGTVFQRNYFEVSRFENFEMLAEKIKEWDEHYGSEKITKTINLNSPNYINYYLEKLNYSTDIKIHQTIYGNQLSELLEIVKDAKTPYFVNGWACIHQPLEAEQLIKRKYPFVVDSVDEFNSSIRLYTFKRDYNRKLLFENDENFKSKESLWNFSRDNIDTTRKDEGEVCLIVSESQEYGPSFRLSGTELEAVSQGILNISAVFKPQNNEVPVSGLWVIEVKSGGENLAWFSSAISDFTNGKTGWHEFFMSAELPANLTSKDEVLIYFWNNQQSRLLFNSLSLRVYAD